MRILPQKPCYKGEAPHRKKVRKVNAKSYRAKKAACLPCRQRKIRCTGKGPPCGTCTAREIGNSCEFAHETTAYPENTVTHALQDASDGGGQPQIWNQSHDITNPPSPSSSVTTLSELSQTPSLNFSDTDEDADANSAVGCILFKQPLNALPSWEMIDNLKARYFANVFPVRCS